jgi:hypothetical protein
LFALLVAANLIAICAPRGFAAGLEVDVVRVTLSHRNALYSIRFDGDCLSDGRFGDLLRMSAPELAMAIAEV